MATPEAHRPSRRLQSAASAERERLSKELSRLDTRATEVQRELDKLEARRLEIREQLSLLARFAGEPEDAQSPAKRSGSRANHLQAVRDDQASPKAVLRGSRIREIAVLLLASSANPRRPIHYQHWYELVRSAGYSIDAQDPAATFLTQINRSPVVRRAGRGGIYTLDLDAPRELRERLRQLETQLQQSTVAGETADELAAAREQRARLLTETRAAERQLEEALRSLGAAAS